MRRFALVSILLLFAAAAAADVLKFEDRARLVTPSDPQISPDGKQIAFVVSRANLKENRFETEIRVIDIAGGDQRQITFERRGVAHPRWSPDGSKIAFLANSGSEKDAKRQVWIAPMRGGDARRITEAAGGVQQFAWDPAGERLAYVTVDAPPVRSETETFNRSFEIREDDYLITAAALPSHLWIVPSAGGASKRLTSGSWSLPVSRPPGPLASPPAWTPDGKSLVFVRAETPHSGHSNSGRVAIVDVASGDVRQLAKADLAQSQPFVSPDGRSVAFTHPHLAVRQSENRIWTVPIAGGSANELTKDLDHNIYRAFWMPDGQSLLVGAHHETTTALWLQTLNGPARRLELGDVEPTAPFSIDGNVGKNGALAFTASTPGRPREVYYMANTSAKPRRLTDFNADFEKIELGRAERITFANEGFDLDGVVITPPRYDPSRRYPLVLLVHGGPRASSTTAFSFLPQILAAQGWIVFQPNYRGSDNLGERVTRAIILDAGAGPGRDVIAGIEAVKKRFPVDEARLAIGGWSYGGYMTSWMIGHYPDLFRAAVSGAAVNNMLDQYNLGDYNVQRGDAWGSPYRDENMKRYIEQSPITYAPKVRTPTLILANTGDARVPFTQSFQMYRALKDNGVKVKFIAYPLSGHNPDDPVHQRDVDRRYVDWFETNLK